MASLNELLTNGPHQIDQIEFNIVDIQTLRYVKTSVMAMIVFIRKNVRVSFGLDQQYSQTI